MAFDPSAYEKSDRPDRRVVPPGKHRVTIQSVDWDSMKATLAVTFESADKTTIRGWYPTEGARGWITANLLKAVGWPHAIEEASAQSRNQALLGQELEIVVVEEEWQGKARMKVKYTNKLPNTPIRSAPDQIAQADDGDDIPF